MSVREKVIAYSLPSTSESLKYLTSTLLFLPCVLKRVVGDCDDIELSGDFHKGMEVEIVGGNLTGIKGKLINAESNKNFLIELDHIGFQLRIEIKPALLKPVRKTKFEAIL